MEARAKVVPGLPRANATISCWQDPPQPIAELHSTPNLPKDVDFVVIGSGISGACIALNLIEKQPDARLLMLEARQACSGATGRNDASIFGAVKAATGRGHTKAASYRSFHANAHAHGVPQAMQIAHLERANMLAMHALARRHGIDCEARRCHSVDIVYDRAQWDVGVRAIEQMRALGCADEDYEIVDQDEARRRFLTPAALGAFVYEAGSMSGYAFVCGLLRVAVTRGVNLQTSTPVTALERDGEARWTVRTERGDVTARTVVLATNGYTAALCPALQGVIVPLRGQAAAQRPGKRLPTSGLATTYSFIHAGGYEYMISRPLGTRHAGDIVIGGGWGMLPDDGAGEFGETDDTVVETAVADYLREATPRYFGEHWGDDHIDGRTRSEWTGIMGTSADGLPYVGEMPGQPGLWVSASFNGHGMVLCLKCAEALTTLMLQPAGATAALHEWFPRAFMISEQRLRVPFQGRRNVTPLPPQPPGDIMETRAQA